MFRDRRYQEAAGVFIILCSIILLLSLLSFSAGDFGLLSGGNSVNNIMGPVGAYLGDFLRGAFGYPSYILVAVFAVAGWRILQRGTPADVLEKMFSLLYFLLTSSLAVSLLTEETAPHFAGGYIGIYLTGFFISIFSETGAFLIAGILNLIALILLGIISFNSIFVKDDNNENTPGFFKNRMLRKISLHRVREDKVPLNHIDEAIKRRGKKPPWIIKKRVPLTVWKNRKKGMLSYDLKLIEFKESASAEKRSMPRRVEPPLEEKISQSDVAVACSIAEPVPEPGYQEFIDDYEELMTEEESAPCYELMEEKEEGGLPIVNVRDNFMFGADIPSDPEPVHYRIDSFDDMEEPAVNFNRIEANRLRAIEEECESRAAVVDEAIDEDIDFDNLNDENEDYDMDYNEDDIDDSADDEDDFDSLDEQGQGSLFRSSDYPVPARVFCRYSIPGGYDVPTEFLELSKSIDIETWKSEMKKTSEQLIRTLNEFGIESRISNVSRGPVITLYEIQIAPGIKVNRIVGLSDDIAMALAASRVRVVAPIPGKSAIGIEVPNKHREIVTLGDVIKSNEYKSRSGGLKVALGKDIFGNPITLDLKKLPHLLIAGATGAGKSVCVNSIISSLLYNYDPNHVRFILIDPKMVELQLYNGLPHLISPVITESHAAPKALKWAMLEMDRRYRLLSEQKTRDIEKYNAKISGHEDQFEKLPYIVIIIDELADLMMISAKEVEGFITRIAQKARAVGIHLVLATQRPSVNIITGVIKANFPARVAFQVAQKIDSRTIIDQNGAEKLLGKGDMLYQSPVNSFPVRIQGAYISEEETNKVVQHIKNYGRASYIDFDESIFDDDEDDDNLDEEAEDKLFMEAFKIIEETKKASASYLQRRLSIGYNRAARIIEMMEDRGFVGPQQGSKPREVYI